MNSFKISYSVEELEGQGVDGQGLRKGMSIMYHNKLFIRASNHPKSFRDIAYQECNKYVESGLDSFVVESRFYLTIWKEKELELGTERVVDSNNNLTNGSSTIENTTEQDEVIISQEDSSEPAPLKQIQEISFKVTPRKYRGQDY